MSGVSRDAVLEMQRHAAHAISLLDAAEGGTMTLVDALDALFESSAPAIAAYDVCVRVMSMPALSALRGAAMSTESALTHPSVVSA